MILPRPELSNLLGVKYRRIPVLAIGNDVYCDTNLIATVLERRFPPSDGYPSLFPRRVGGGRSDTGFVKAATKFWTDTAIFPVIADSLPWSRVDPKLLADRSAVGTVLQM
jgi:glutathione S-transferase